MSAAVLEFSPLLRVFGSLYNRCESCVHILCSKSDLVSMGVGLHQGCPWSLILFVVLMDRVSRCSRGEERVQFGDLRITSLLYVVDVVLLDSTGEVVRWSRTLRAVFTVSAVSQTWSQWVLGSIRAVPGL